jgi:hypothetical protein
MNTKELRAYREVSLMKWLTRLALCSMILAFCMLNLSGILWAEEQPPESPFIKGDRPHPEKTMTAVRANPLPPKIDGVLDDEVWQYAPIATGFTQKQPNEGEPATEKTTVQIAYDDESLYIGIVCYDSEPGKIVSRLTRRDQWAERDSISVNLDAHHDHQTGNFFGVGPSGWVMDGSLYNDTSGDNTWDGVWEAKTSIHDQGWSVEYRIPYHVLRFSSKDEYTWGINVDRTISRKNEQDWWIMVPSKESGHVSRFGHLEGIKGISPPAHLEVLPYVVGRSSFIPESAAHPEGRDLFSSAGADLRYGITPNISLNAAINPDFGQVEADPAVLNLTVFETFFEERRPFFIEGNTIFRTPWPDIAGIDGPPQLFYSRRIGKQPGHFSIPDDSELIDRPNATTILGAAKLSGKTAGKTSFGIMEAVTSNEYATIERTATDPGTGLERTEQEKFRIEPLTNFFIGRIQQDVRTNSTLGAMLTAVNRESDTPAYVAEVDGNLKWKKNAYTLYTRLAGSRTGPLDERINGYSALAYFYKFSGWFGGQLYADARSPEFEVNDLGFMNRNNWIQSGGHAYARIRKPWALARQSMFNVNAWSHWNYDGVNLVKGVNFNTWHDLKNYWFFQIGISREFETWSDLETRGGPLVIRPARFWYWSNFGTDDRKLISLHFNYFGTRADDAFVSVHSVSTTATIRPASNIEFQIGPSYRSEFNFAQWVKNVDDDEDGQDDHYVFGELKSRTLDFTTRATVAFTTNLTLQLYIQPFVAVGDYNNLKELARPKSYEFTPYAKLDENPDFSRRSLRGNVVLRWEYRPGSTLFLVWSQSRSASLDIGDPAFRPFEGVRESFTDEGENVFLIKTNYWLGM